LDLPNTIIKQSLKSWVTSSRCVFLNKVLIIRPNATYSSSAIVFYYTLQNVSAVQINHHQVDVGYTNRIFFVFFWFILHLPDD